MCSPRWTKENRGNSFTAAALCFWLPSIILLLSNILIIHAIRTLHSRTPNQNSVADNQNNSTNDVKRHTKTMRSFYILVAVYFLCSSPYFGGKFSYVVKEGGLLQPSLMVFCMLLMFTSSSINPFIYSFLRKEHRKALKKTVELMSSRKEKIFTSIRLKLGNITSCCKMSSKNSK